MADIINLNRARKAKDRQQREQDAAANRRKFGRTKAERQRDQQEAERRQRLLDGTRLDPGQDEGE